MAPITLEHAALAIAGVGMALNVYVAFRISRLRTRIRVIPLKPGEALQASAFLPPDLGVYPHTAGSTGTAPGELPAVDTSKDAGIGNHGDAGPGLHPVGKLHLLNVVTEDSGALLIRLSVMERDLGDSHRKVAGIDDLHASAPDVRPGDVHRDVAHLQPHGVLSDQPHGVEHAERSAQHRNP